MNSDIDRAADTVIGLTNTVGATAASVQNTRQTVRVLRQLLDSAQQKPERLAAAGVGLLLWSAVAAWRNHRGPTGPSD